MILFEKAKQLLSIDTSPAAGNFHLVDLLSQMANEDGFFITRQDEEVGGIQQSNLLLRPQRQRPQSELLLQTHLDTAEPGNSSQWKHALGNPFSATLVDGYIYGLGAADTKLDFLCKYEAAKLFLDRELREPFVLAATFGAQTGMQGAIRLMRKKMISARRALIGEPTQLQLMSAGLGLAVVELIIPFSDEEIKYRDSHNLQESGVTQSRYFRGEAAHSSRPQLGENAIVKMLDYLCQLPSGIAVLELDGGVAYNSVPASAVLEIDLVPGFKKPITEKIAAIVEASKKMERELVAASEGPLKANMNIGLIRTFEEDIRVITSCRFPPSISDGQFSAWMDEWALICERNESQMRVIDYKKPFSLNCEHEWVKSLQKIAAQVGLDQTLGTIETATEASVFQRLGVDCVVFGPGQGIGNSCAPDERVHLDELERAKNFYQALFEQVCL